MTRYSKGQHVVATRDLHRLLSGRRVPRGSRGLVVDAPMFGRAVVVFVIRSLWNGDRHLELDVEDHEISPE